MQAGLHSQASSSIGRATVSKTVGCGFDSCLACLIITTPLRSRGSQASPSWEASGRWSVLFLPGDRGAGSLKALGQVRAHGAEAKASA